MIADLEDGCAAPNAGKVVSGLGTNPPKLNDAGAPVVNSWGFAAANENPCAVLPALNENGFTVSAMVLAGVDVMLSVCCVG